MAHINVTLKLADEPQEYEFPIQWRDDPPVLHIPWDRRGPRWHCQWQFQSSSSCGEFIAGSGR